MAEKANALPTETEAVGKLVEQKRPGNHAPAWIAIILALLIFAPFTVFPAFVMPTGSMEDTLLIGDHFLVSKLAYAGANQTPKHGDIILLRYPADIRQTFVKRVIGVPGDRIRMLRGVVYRNGAKLNEPYAFRKGARMERAYDPYRDDFPAVAPSGFDAGFYPPLLQELQHDMLSSHVANGEVVVPPNNYFTLGDNRDNSLDSRYWGFVPRENIIGKPIIIYWSYRASTEELAGSSVDSLVSHMADLAQHFFTRTRWDRTFKLVPGFSDSDLPVHELPVNEGSPNP